MTNLEIASFICQELMDIGIKTTLSGGFCVEIYSFGASHIDSFKK